MKRVARLQLIGIAAGIFLVALWATRPSTIEACNKPDVPRHCVD
jgi:hypothetical protein